MEEIKKEETLKEEETPKNEEISQNGEPITNEDIVVTEEPQVIEEVSDNEDVPQNEEEQEKEKSHKIENISEKIKIFEPFLRVIEVIFIGILSIAIAINANTIADRANEIADNQLKSEQMEMQPHFSLKRELIANDAGEENATEKITVTVTEGRAENITIDTITTIEIIALSAKLSTDNLGVYSESSKTVLVRIFNYFNSNYTGNNFGNIVEFSQNNNYKSLCQLNEYALAFDGRFNDVLFKKIRTKANEHFDCWYCNIDTIFRIIYTDYIGEEHTEYFSVNYNGQHHLNEKAGEERYSKYDDCILSYQLGAISVKSLKSDLEQYDEYEKRGAIIIR